MATLGEPMRQHRFLTALQRHVPALPWIDAVLVIGSLAAGGGDGASDVDLLVCLRDGTFDLAWRHRHDLHATGAVLDWDHWLNQANAAGTHKWLTADFVLVETLIAEPSSGVRLAPSWRVLAGDQAAGRRWPPRPPISAAELRADPEQLHPIEAAYDRFKRDLRRAATSTAATAEDDDVSQ
jgi:hypothetical protein